MPIEREVVELEERGQRATIRIVIVYDVVLWIESQLRDISSHAPILLVLKWLRRVKRQALWIVWKFEGNPIASPIHGDDGVIPFRAIKEARLFPEQVDRPTRDKLVGGEVDGAHTDHLRARATYTGTGETCLA